MKLAIGYSLPTRPRPEISLMQALTRHREQIGELYFAWPGEPSGRLPLGLGTDLAEDEVIAQLETDLQTTRELGISLTLLFNAACYGQYARSQPLADYVCRRVDDLATRFGLGTVTTTSPLIAAVVKAHFPQVKTRASVNMRIGTIKGAEYVAPYFDGYYLQREHNRDFERLREMRDWCDREGKTLHILANSGCLPFCSGQSFHDNLVAHDDEAAEIPMIDFDPSICRHFYRDPANWVRLLQSTWIRPEDLHHFDGLVDTVKLATRMHDDPARVITAYAEARYDGNLLDLFEPGHGSMLANRQIDNNAFPEYWFEQTSSCARNCHSGCTYCVCVLHDVLKVRHEPHIPTRLSPPSTSPQVAL